MKKIFILLACFAMANNITAQNVGIGTATPSTSAALEVKSNTRGLLIPVMNTAARNAIAAPANGLLVYDSTARAFYYYKNTGWKSFVAINALIDADGNTMVEVERTVNDDIVRITTGGNDHTAFTKNATGANPVINYPLLASNNFLVGTNSGWNLKAGYSGNAFVGIQSGFGDSTGTNNTFVGNYSGYGVFTGSKNVAVGLNAGYNMANGSNNVNIGMNAGWGTRNTSNSIHIGHETGYKDSATERNIAIGSHALYKNKSDGNIAIGAATLSNSNGINGGSIAIGDSALTNNTAGYRNIGIGDQSLYNNENGYENIAIGPYTLYNNKDAESNIAMGLATLYRHQTGFYNNAIGSNSMLYHRFGSHNIAIGASSLSRDTVGYHNTIIGSYSMAGQSVENTAIGTFTQGQNKNSFGNSSLGFYSLRSNEFGNNNTAIGKYSMASNRTGYSNVAIGIRSLSNNSYGSNLVAIGDSAMQSNDEGIQNTAVGSKSLRNNYSGSANTAMGFESLYTNSYGFSNTANGFNALHNNTYGNNNTATGSQALSTNISTHNNTANGSQALINNNGSQNTAIGARALLLNTDGSGNVAEGFETLITNTTGTQNIGIGYQAGSNGGGTTQFNYNSFCIFLGANANAFSNSGGSSGLLNSIAIGKLASVTASNQVRVGDNLITSIGGYVGWTNFSDGRYKKNITANVPGLDFIVQLQPVTYQIDINGLNKHFNIKPDSTAALENSRQQFIAKKEQQLQTGFIAQDVETVAKSLGYNFSGVDKPENPQGMYGLRYAEFVVPLVKAVQELDANNKNLQLQIELFKHQNQLLLKRFEVLESKK